MLNSLINECTDYDFKEKLESNRPKSWLKSVSAFANGIGGTLFFGISDDKKIIGIENYKDTISRISEQIQAKIEPVPIFSLNSIDFDGHIVIKLNVLPGQFTPYYYKNDGVMIAFVRLGDESIPAPSYILNELILKGTGQTYDSVLTNEKKGNYSFTYLSSKYLNLLNFQLKENDLSSFGLSENEYLTRAGVLFADTNKVRQSRIFCTRRNGIDKISDETVLNDLEISGSLLLQLDMAMDFYKANTNNKWKKENGNTVYYPDYDDEAIKEALVNAIVHRDYNVAGAEVVLNIYDNRIEITSPGGMYSGKKLPNIVDFVTESKRRNPVIADLFHKLKLMNRRGSGLANITNKTNKLFNYDGNHVSFSADNEFFTVTIENANYGRINKLKKDTINDTINDTTNDTINDTKKNNLSNNDNNIIELIIKNEKITIGEMAKAINVSRITVIRSINKLCDLGIIRRVGSNKMGYWEVTK